MIPVSTPSRGEAERPAILTREDGATIAYHRRRGSGPGVVFLGGFMSDMTGTKARTLDAFCAARGQAYLRFDYFGHGASSGAFADATVGRWKEDALAAIDQLTEGPQLLVGSIPLPDPDDTWQGRIDLPPDDRWSSAEVGCRYRPRCPFAMSQCAEAPPPLYEVGANHFASCYLYEGRPEFVTVAPAAT